MENSKVGWVRYAPEVQQFSRLRNEKAAIKAAGNEGVVVRVNVPIGLSLAEIHTLDSLRTVDGGPLREGARVKFAGSTSGDSSNNMFAGCEGTLVSIMEASTAYRLWDSFSTRKATGATVAEWWVVPA